MWIEEGVWIGCVDKLCQYGMLILCVGPRVCLLQCVGVDRVFHIRYVCCY